MGEFWFVDGMLLENSEIVWCEKNEHQGENGKSIRNGLKEVKMSFGVGHSGRQGQILSRCMHMCERVV